MAEHMIQVGSIELNGGTQLRVDKNQEKIERYAEDMKRGDKFPKAVVFEDDDKKRWMGDGHSRAEARLLAGFKTIDATVRQGSREDAIRYAAKCNHTHGEAYTRADRRNAVLEVWKIEKAKEKPASNNNIAKMCGVSDGLVATVIEEWEKANPAPATEANGTPHVPNMEPGARTGADGKIYPARKPRVLCERCTRFVESGGEAQKNCPMCAEVRKAAKGSKSNGKAPKGKAAPPAEVKDQFGVVVPKPLKDALFDPWAEQTLTFLEGISETFRSERIADGMKKREKRLPFFNATDVIDGTGFIIENLDRLIKHFKEATPAGVCPACEGEKCGKCKSSGLVPADLRKELAKAKK